MSRAAFSAAMTEMVDQVAREHLLRHDRQEDICFALWYPSRGRSRYTGLVKTLVLPLDGERNVHGNASFNPAYLERAMAEAMANDAGLALMHSHPFGTGWQSMSDDDVIAEQGTAGAVYGATGLPFLGLTMGGDGAWSARFWQRVGPRTYARDWCSTVRVVGNSLKVSFNEQLAPRPRSSEKLIRTVSAWGEQAHADLTRLRVAVVGAGSVGGFIAEGLARTGFEDIMLIDFDRIEKHNLDRLMYALARHVGKLKVQILRQRLKLCATAEIVRVEALNCAVFEETGFRAALDSDVIVCCVDRPWGRHVLNQIAYAHLIPVIDGGISVRANKHDQLVAADWKAHTATFGRPCLQCLRQYDPGLVQMEREGRLDDPHYIEALPRGHTLKARENVFAFSMSCASLQMLQLLALTLSPLDQPNPGSQLYHFVGGFMEKPTFGACTDDCLFPGLIAKGDRNGFKLTGNSLSLR